MIALLRGRLVSRDQNMVILDINGIGYQLHLSGAALDMAKSTADQITVHTHVLRMTELICMVLLPSMKRSCSKRSSLFQAWAVRLQSIF